MYKIFRLRKDGTFGSLFVDRKRKLKKGKWYQYNGKLVPKGLATRPGWHMSVDVPKHLSLRGDRVLCVVDYGGILGTHTRPKKQGGTWITSAWIKINGIVAHSARSAR